MAPAGITWTHPSVRRLAGAEDPISVIERRARDLVLKAKDQGWQGPPFNPIGIADLLGISVEANADVRDARIALIEGKLRIEFNPTQPRERVRFSIAHEVAHAIFPDVATQVRHRAGPKDRPDEWQLEMLCNLAAAEFVMPIGSLPEMNQVPPIEELMIDRRKYDVSAEAYLIRVSKIASAPIQMFCASPTLDGQRLVGYSVDYSFASKTAPKFQTAARNVPADSIVFTCVAIGHTAQQSERWFSRDVRVECVGIPGYPGASFPRVAGIIRFDPDEASPQPISLVHGDVLQPVGGGTKIICQLVNDQARRWGGGIAKSASKKFPAAEQQFSEWLMSTPRKERLGKVHWADIGNSTFLASIVGQSGFGESLFPRIRYQAVEKAFKEIAAIANQRAASVHMPRLGTGAAGATWETVEEMVVELFGPKGVPVTIYDPPPRRLQQAELF